MEQEDKIINKISGIQILKYLKDKSIFNQGIQIIIFSASSDSFILDEVHTKGVLGYIKKDSPINKYTPSKNALKKMKQLISGKDKALGNKYLKEVWTIQNSILKLSLFDEDDEYFHKIKFEIDTIFEILNSNIENKIKFTLITIFKVLEILTDKYFKGDSKIGAYKKITSIIRTFKIDIDNGKISQLVCTRNFLVHSGEIRKDCKEKDKVIKKPNQENIIIWFKMLQTILEAIDKDSK